MFLSDTMQAVSCIVAWVMASCDLWLSVAHGVINWIKCRATSITSNINAALIFIMSLHNIHFNHLNRIFILLHYMFSIPMCKAVSRTTWTSNYTRVTFRYTSVAWSTAEWMAPPLSETTRGEWSWPKSPFSVSPSETVVQTAQLCIFTHQIQTMPLQQFNFLQRKCIYLQTYMLVAANTNVNLSQFYHLLSQILQQENINKYCKPCLLYVFSIPQQRVASDQMSCQLKFI